MTTAGGQGARRGAGTSGCFSHQPGVDAATASDRQRLWPTAATGMRPGVGHNSGVRRRPPGRRRVLRTGGRLTMWRGGGAMAAAAWWDCSPALRWLLGRDALPRAAPRIVSPAGKTDLLYDPPAAVTALGPLSGPDLADPAEPAVAGRPRSSRQRRWSSTCGPVVRSVPGRVTQLQQVYDATRAPGFLLGTTSATTTAGGPGLRQRPRVTSVDLDPAMRTLIAFGGSTPTTVIPSRWCWTANTVRGGVLRELLAGPATCGAAAGSGTQVTGFAHLAAAARCGGAGRLRAGRVVSFAFALRGAVGAGYSLSGRGGGVERRPRRRHKARRVGRCEFAGMAAAFSCAGIHHGVRARHVAGTRDDEHRSQAVLQRSVRRADHRMGLVFVGLNPGAGSAASGQPSTADHPSRVRRLGAVFCVGSGRRGLGP